MELECYNELMTDKQKIINEMKKDKQLVDQLLSGNVDEKYQGKQLVVIGGEKHVLPDDDKKAVKLVEKLEKKYPKDLPHLVTVPRAETYILGSINC